jgi:hypothetical protein
LALDQKSEDSLTKSNLRFFDTNKQAIKHTHTQAGTKLSFIFILVVLGIFCHCARPNFDCIKRLLASGLKEAV